MKKITFLALLFACSLNAQTYCTISEDYEDIEEITSVAFGTTTITNSSTDLIYIDKISTLANVTVGDSYNLTVKGNTNGNYDNEFIAYIDWNHNGILDDTGEVFYIGLITDSTGDDTKSASTSITIPATALAGNTRIRIMKVWTDSDPDFTYELNYDPCWISANDVFFEEIVGSYGQALDFTLNVSTLNRDAFDKNAVVIYPNPTSAILNIDTDKSIDGVSIFNLQGQLMLESKNSNKINVQSLATGTYFLKIISENLSQVKKFVKN